MCIAWTVIFKIIIVGQVSLFSMSAGSVWLNAQVCLKFIISKCLFYPKPSRYFPTQRWIGFSDELSHLWGLYSRCIFIHCDMRPAASTPCVLFWIVTDGVHSTSKCHSHLISCGAVSSIVVVFTSQSACLLWRHSYNGLIFLLCWDWEV